MAQWNGAPDAAQDLSAVLLQYESNLLEVPLSPVIMSHTTVWGWQPWSSACPEAPVTVTQTQPNIHTQQMSMRNTGPMSTEPMVELKFLQQLLCKWITLPKEGPLQDLSQNDVPWVLTYHIFQIC